MTAARLENIVKHVHDQIVSNISLSTSSAAALAQRTQRRRWLNDVKDWTKTAVTNGWEEASPTPNFLNSCFNIFSEVPFAKDHSLVRVSTV